MRVPHVPDPGEIIHASEWWEDAGGGGAVAAVQLAKLAGACDFFTALGDDERGRRSRERLEELGVAVFAAPREGPQRRGFVYLDGDGERTITILGDRIVPHGDDELPWERLDGIDAVYFTGGDEGALRQARRARTARGDAARLRHAARAAASTLDALVRSAKDPGEQQAEEHWTRSPTWSSRRPARRAASGWARTTRATTGRRPTCPARGATPTAPAIRSPPGLTYRARRRHAEPGTR